jgi:membrane-bound lytic murein transglycosylase B
VDYDRDGRKDIWSTKADIFASAANYLSENGWDREYTWGRPVTLTRDIPDELLGRKSKRPLSFWAGKGVRRMDGRALPAVNIDAGLIKPGDGPADNDYFLVYDNFDVIMRWNASSYFATSVGLLANKIAP